MDTRHVLYVTYVAEMTTQTHLLSENLGLYIIYLTRNRVLMGDIHTLNIGLVTFHIDKDGSDLNTERIRRCIKQVQHLPRIKNPGQPHDLRIKTFPNHTEECCGEGSINYTKKINKQSATTRSSCWQHSYDCDRYVYTSAGKTGKDGDWTPAKLWRNN